MLKCLLLLALCYFINFFKITSKHIKMIYENNTTLFKPMLNVAISVNGIIKYIACSMIIAK